MALQSSRPGAGEADRADRGDVPAERRRLERRTEPPPPAARVRHRRRPGGRGFALPPGHPYLRLPLQFATAFEERLRSLITADELATLREHGEAELRMPGRWGTTFTLVQLGPLPSVTAVGWISTNWSSIPGRRRARADLRRRLRQPRSRRRRPALPGLQFATGLHEPRSPAPAHRCGHQGTGRPPLCACTRPCVRCPGRSSALDRRGRAERARPRAVHDRRHGDHRACGMDGPPVDRSAEGAGRPPFLSRLRHASIHLAGDPRRGAATVGVASRAAGA